MPMQEEGRQGDAKGEGSVRVSVSWRECDRGLEVGTTWKDESKRERRRRKREGRRPEKRRRRSQRPSSASMGPSPLRQPVQSTIRRSRCRPGSSSSSLQARRVSAREVVNQAQEKFTDGLCLVGELAAVARASADVLDWVKERGRAVRRDRVALVALVRRRDGVVRRRLDRGAVVAGLPGEVGEVAAVQQAGLRGRRASVQDKKRGRESETNLVGGYPVADFGAGGNGGRLALESVDVGNLRVRDGVLKPRKHLQTLGGGGQFEASSLNRKRAYLLVRDDPDVLVRLNPVKEGLQHLAGRDRIRYTWIADCEVNRVGVETERLAVALVCAGEERQPSSKGE